MYNLTGISWFECSAFWGGYEMPLQKTGQLHILCAVTYMQHFRKSNKKRKNRKTNNLPVL